MTRYNKRLVFFLALITATIFFLPFLISDNGYFLFYGDFNVQQIPFYKLCHQAVHDGNVFWNFNTDLGANFIGSYSFYLLGSPFFWLTIPFPNEFVPYLMAPLLILKFALTALTGYCYIQRFVKNQRNAVLGGLLYAFCGFNIYNIFFNHFNEVVLIFPLLLIALEESVVNNRKGLLAVTVAFSAIVNYYFFFGEVFFVIIYFCVRLFDKDFNVNFKKFLLLAFEAVIGLLMSMFLLLPSILAIIDNPRISGFLTGFNMFFYDSVQRYGLILSSFFFPPDIPARPNFFPDSNAKWASVSAYLPLFSVVGVITFLRYFKKHFAKRLIIIMVGVAFIPILNSMFSAFNYGYYARWYYMLILMMVLGTVLVLERQNTSYKLSLWLTGLGIAGFAMIGVAPKKVEDSFEFFNLPGYPALFWVYIFIAVISLIAVGILIRISPKNKQFFRLTSASICVFTIFYATIIIFAGKTNGDNPNRLINDIIGGEYTTILNEEQFYRIDSYDEIDNLGMFWKKPSINAFHSIVPGSIIDYYNLIGVDRGVGSRPEPQYVGVRALNSVRYQFITKDKKDKRIVEGFSFLNEQNGYEVYENEYFIPMGFTYDKSISTEQLEKIPKTSYDRTLVSALLLDDNDAKKYSDCLPNVEIDSFANESFTTDRFLEDCEARKANSGYYFKTDNNGFTSKIKLDKPNLVFFSVPYDKGFTAIVNGQKAEIIKANAGFMAVLCEAGDNEIRFSYMTPGLAIGFYISAAALLALIIYIGIWTLLKHINPNRYHIDKYAHLQVTMNNDTE